MLTVFRAADFHLVVVCRPPKLYSQFGRFVSELVLYSDEIIIIDVISADLSKASNLNVKALALIDKVFFYWRS